MGKTGKWIKNFLIGKKDKEKGRENPRNHNQISSNGGGDENRHTIPMSVPQPTAPREKRRWSFRRSSATAPGRQETNAVKNAAADTTPPVIFESDKKKRALAVATAAAADGAAGEAKSAAFVIQTRAAASGSRRSAPVEEAAAIKIQSCFRGYLARKALNALKGLVKLQALVRGHLVRKQAATTLRCMQALINVQVRARVQRLRMAAEETKLISQTRFNHRKSPQDTKDFDKNHEENIKIVEMDLGGNKTMAKPRNSYSNHTPNHIPNDPRISTPRASLKLQEGPCQISPSPSAITESSPRACSNHFEEYSFETTQNSAQCYTPIISKLDQARLPYSYPRSECAEPIYDECSFYPSYMANTESSKAKLRSHSAPKQRPLETFERQPSRTRRPSLEGRSHVPKAVRMQRSSSHVRPKAQNYPNSYSVKLDRSNVSIKESECGSTSTIMSNTTYSRSLVGIFDVQGVGTNFLLLMNKQISQNHI
ncbi:protein IQ-DOMAIN 19-like isoform X2 [Primulina eburnea]|uniref:protein IQ-DOMAIN 19-like isoform X2 n=1 Tax=Primulina eburnea TaxID=1245227 RepID=UPI003C6C24A0